MLGADVPRAILIRVNIRDLAAQKGGAAGSVVSRFLPQFTESKVLETMRDQIAAKFKDEGVVADVLVVPDVGAKTVLGGSDLVTGLCLGAAGSVAGWAAWKFFLKGLFA